MAHRYKGKVCNCGRGYQSKYDGKCGHCRTRREKAEHERLRDPVRSVDPMARRYGFHNETLN